MRFIRKNGRVIPIRDGGSHASARKGRGYQAGNGRLVAQGALGAGAAVTGTYGGLYAVRALSRELSTKELTRAAALAAGHKGFLAASAALAAYHIATATHKGGGKEGAVEAAKQGAAWKVGGIVGAIPGGTKLMKESMTATRDLMDKFAKGRHPRR
jgi:hypothetical protein